MQRFSRPLLCRALLIGAATLLAVPVGVGLATVDADQRARALNRPLTPLPRAGAVLSDPFGAARQLTEYAADRSLGLLGSARGLAAFRYEVLGDAGAANTVRNGNLVFVADHDLFGARQNRAIRQSCTDPGEGGLGARMIARGARLAEAAGAPARKVGILIVPSKPVLYADRLPAAVPAALRARCARARVETGWAEAWRAEAAARGHVMAYPLAAFEAARDRPHFYPPENFHTEGAAAHLAAWSMLDRLYPGEFPPGSVPFETVRGVADMRSVYLYDRAIALREPQYGARTPRRDPATEARLRERYPNIRTFFAWRNRGAGTGRRALVIGNSFSQHVTPDLAVGFDETVLVFTNRLTPKGAAGIFRWLIPQWNPDAVIFVHHEAAHKGTGLSRLMAGLEPGG